MLSQTAHKKETERSPKSSCNATDVVDLVFLVLLDVV